MVKVKIAHDNNFKDKELWGEEPYSVIDYLYDVSHEFEGCTYLIVDSSNEVLTGRDYTGFVVAEVSGGIIDVMTTTGIEFETVSS